MCKFQRQNTAWKWCTTLTPLSLRNGVRAGAIGVRLLGGLNMLGAVGLRNGALGIPLRGAGDIKQVLLAGLWLTYISQTMYALVVSNFLTSPLPLAWKGTPAVFFSCCAVSVAGRYIQNKNILNPLIYQNNNIPTVPLIQASVSKECSMARVPYISEAALPWGLHSWAFVSAGNAWQAGLGAQPAWLKHFCLGTGTPVEASQMLHTRSLGGEEERPFITGTNTKLPVVPKMVMECKRHNSYLSHVAPREYPVHLDSAPPNPDWENQSLERTWGYLQPLAPKALNPQ